MNNSIHVSSSKPRSLYNLIAAGTSSIIVAGVIDHAQFVFTVDTDAAIDRVVYTFNSSGTLGAQVIGATLFIDINNYAKGSSSIYEFDLLKDLQALTAATYADILDWQVSGQLIF